MESYDYVIVGGGSAGLYCARQLEMKHKKRILIVEANSYLGGRTRMDKFHSRMVNTGAGVGRYKKDILLKGLVKEMEGIRSIWKSNICYDFKDPVDVVSYINYLLRMYSMKELREMRYMYNFKEFFLKHFSRRVYRQFCLSNGYTDFERADLLDTMMDYGFDDNRNGSEFFSVDWNKLISHLKSKLRYTKIYLNTKMTRCEKDSDNWIVYTTKGTYQAKKLIIAGFLHPILGKDVCEGIGVNSFLRMYGYGRFKDDRLCGMIFRKDEFQKTIPFGGTRSTSLRQTIPFGGTRSTSLRQIRMLAYCDNKNADKVRDYSFNKIQTIIKDPIQDVKKYYWKVGTHFYYPLSRTFKNRNEFISIAQNPQQNLFVIGEMVSKNQGWTEGALQSVLHILPKLI